ncbi:MAG: 30S ribosomal protein S20 [Acidobacteria bacterium]|nr:30S ribosomal protein S20 [Acidobacteriota bacterium]
MPNIQSAIKALRQSKKRQVKNLVQKNAYKNAVKDFRKLVTEGKLSEAKKALPIVFKKLDKAAKTGVIKKNKASRLKSNTSRLLNKSSAK